MTVKVSGFKGRRTSQMEFSISKCHRFNFFMCGNGTMKLMSDFFFPFTKKLGQCKKHNLFAVPSYNLGVGLGNEIGLLVIFKIFYVSIIFFV